MVADRVEREIQSLDAKGNVHMAEERQQEVQEERDETGRYEEMKYSGVYRNSNKGKQ